MAVRRRNHYVPQVLLRRFASRTDGKKSWVWQTSEDKRSVEISTRDAAVGSFFYGSSPGSVEEAFGPIEAEFGRVLKSIDAGEPVDSFGQELRRFVYLLFIRTKALREQFADAADVAVKKFVESATPNRLGEAVRRELDTSFEECLAKAVSSLPVPQRKTFLALASTPRLREAIKAHAVGGIKHLDTFSLMDSLLSAAEDGLPTAAQDGQINALAKLLSEAHTPETFSPTHWDVQVRDAGRFILGDCCAIAESADGQFGSILRFGKDWHSVFLPVSPKHLLVGCRGDRPGPLDYDKIDQISAGLSRSYVYSAESTSNVRALAQRIGQEDALITAADIDSIMGEVWEFSEDGPREHDV